MKPMEPEEETPLAWNAVLEHTPVYSSDDTEVGIVSEVLGAADIFHGLVVRTGPSAREVVVPGDQVPRITNKRIQIAVSADEVKELPTYEPEESYKLGIVGVFRKTLGWVHDDARHD